MNYRPIVNKYILNPIKIILELIYGSVKVIFFSDSVYRNLSIWLLNYKAEGLLCS